ncbi:MAG: glycosyltransferase family 1 protein [Bacteroidales bacterium]|nr:glycosyltransferase family 1 protein [Bacteroidales bacterium]
MKRILVDLSKLSNLNCGLGQVALNFGKTFSETQTEFEKHFLVPKDYVGFFGNKELFYHTKSNINKLIKEDYFDLWHSIHQDPDILPPASTPVLMTIHDLNFLEEKNSSKSKKRLQKLQKKVDVSSHFAFISEFSKKIAIENLNFGEKSKEVIYNGVATSNAKSNPLNIDADFFFTIGVLKPKKNFKVLIPMMRYFPEYKLVIAGDKKGNYYKELVKTAKKENVLSQIIFTGTISEAEKNWYYQNCKAFLFPSLYEGFGLPVIEAMRFGVPVIISANSSLPEIGSTHAFYFSEFSPEVMYKTIKESLVKFSENPDLKTAEIDYSLQFDWKTNVKSYLNLYNKIIDSILQR